VVVVVSLWLENSSMNDYLPSFFDQLAYFREETGDVVDGEGSRGGGVSS
jgi:hypothetical protein